MANYSKKLMKSSFSLLGMVSAIVVANTITTTPAEASGCSFPPCGAFSNKSIIPIKVRWKDDDKASWKYDYVSPNSTKGGWLHDGLDIDGFFVPKKCHASGYILIDAGSIGNYSFTAQSGWHKISSTQILVVDSLLCQGGGL